MLRVGYEIHYIRIQIMAFIGSFRHLGKIFVPILFFLLYYAVVGLHLFQGVTEYRCRETEHPEHGEEWVAVEGINNLCGVW